MKTKDKLLKTALELFAKQGIDKTSTAQITKAVGVSTGALFVHFKTKQALVDTIYIAIKHYSLSNLQDLLDSHRSVEENIKIGTKSVVHYFLKHYEQFVFLELIEKDPQVSETALEAGKQEYETLQKYWQRWQINGNIRNCNLSFLYSLWWGTVSTIIRYGHEQKWQTVGDEYLDLVWDVVRR